MARSLTPRTHARTHTPVQNVSLFLKSIALSKDQTGLDRPDPGNELAARIAAINDYHTLAMYNQTCIGLFAKHKLLLSFQLCTKILGKMGKLNTDEADFLLRGFTVLDRSTQPTNPDPEWIDQAMWDNLCGADELLEALQGIIGSFQSQANDWKNFFMDSTPEVAAMPGEWSNKLDELQKMVILRCVRPDRLTQAVASYVTTFLGRQFVEPPAFDLEAIFKNSAPRTPLIFILSPGVDPAHHIQKLSDEKEISLEQCALGQGQAPIATRMLNDGVKHGGWAYLANCHLSISWMPALEKLIDNFCNDVVPHKDFRLWLSSSPHKDFPIAVLQLSIKMTTEPPQGLKANLGRLYMSVTEERFERSPPAAKPKYKRLLFSLCWFHALILERRKFRSLGWAIPYEFNDSDFQICEDILGIYLADYEQTPFEALRYLISEANYGGRVTDDWDRRLLNVYMDQFFCEEAISVPNFQVSAAAEYYIPADGERDSYLKYISRLPAEDPTVAFGQHGNAQVASQRTNTVELLGTLLDLQPRVVVEGAESDDDKVLRIIRDIGDNLVAPFDPFTVREQLESRSDPDPLKEVLRQEVDRYNALIRILHRSVTDLDLGIRGLVSITEELEEVQSALLAGRVPSSWSTAYPSLKPLGSWVDNFFARVAALKGWVSVGLPASWMMEALTYPTGFLTALLQCSSRANGEPIDALSWSFNVIPTPVEELKNAPKEGVYVHGLVVEGACWDMQSGNLADAEPMKLLSAMPVIHFMPRSGKSKQRGTYSCPAYMYPIRTGTRERHPFVVAIALKAGRRSPEFWTKRGVACLLSTAD